MAKQASQTVTLQPNKPQPFLKWAGGKRGLVHALVKKLPKRFGSYVEPFIGAGALFFELLPKPALLSDINKELITAYRTIRDNPAGVIESLKIHFYDREYFYRVRDVDPLELTEEERTARMIYLNKTGFNGLYRVNKKGKFNVPFGRYTNPRILDEENIYSVSESLQGVVIENFGFEAFPWQLVHEKDFVYFDPPYVPKSKTSSFTTYAKGGFAIKNQIALAELFSELTDRGVYCMLSNSDSKTVRDLYRKFNIFEVKAARNINSVANLRAPIGELIVTNY